MGAEDDVEWRRTDRIRTAWGSQGDLQHSISLPDWRLKHNAHFLAYKKILICQISQINDRFITLSISLQYVDTTFICAATILLFFKCSPLAKMTKRTSRIEHEHRLDYGGGNPSVTKVEDFLCESESG